MLLVADKDREDEVIRVFEKWGLDAVIVGEVIAEPRLRILHHGQVVADIPNQSLTDDAPLYHRPVGEWKAPVNLSPPRAVLDELTFFEETLNDATASAINYDGRIAHPLLSSSNICSKNWVHEQYESMVQTNTVAGSRAARQASCASGHQPWPGHGARRQRTMVLPGSQTRGFARCRRGGAQGRLHRRDAGGGNQLPQFRQP